MDDTDRLREIQVGIVGPCTAGKSTLIQRLNGKFEAQFRHIAQEHSYVQAMWQKINRPDWLIFLDVSYPVSLERRPYFNWTVEEYQEQQRRLAHAHQHANYYLQTDQLSAEQVAEKVSAFLRDKGILQNNSNDSPTL